MNATRHSIDECRATSASVETAEQRGRRREVVAVVDDGDRDGVGVRPATREPASAGMRRTQVATDSSGMRAGSTATRIVRAAGTSSTTPGRGSAASASCSASTSSSESHSTSSAASPLGSSRRLMRTPRSRCRRASSAARTARGHRDGAGGVAVQAERVGGELDPAAVVGRDAAGLGELERAIGCRGGVVDDRAGLAAGHERAVGDVAAVDEGLAGEAEARGIRRPLERARRAGRARAGSGRSAATASANACAAALVDREPVVQRAVRLHVPHADAGAARDPVERAELGEQLGGDLGRARVERTSPEAHEVAVAGVRAERHAVTGGAPRARGHRHGVAGVEPARDVRARDEGEHRLVVADAPRAEGLAEVAVEVDRRPHAPILPSPSAHTGVGRTSMRRGTHRERTPRRSPGASARGRSARRARRRARPPCARRAARLDARRAEPDARCRRRRPARLRDADARRRRRRRVRRPCCCRPASAEVVASGPRRRRGRSCACRAAACS